MAEEGAGRAVTIVIPGASGDLAKRKLFPALAQLLRNGLLPDSVRVVGMARRDWDQAQFAAFVADSLPEGSEKLEERLLYFKADLEDPESFRALAGWLAQQRLPQNLLFYLSVKPDLFAPCVEAIHEAGLIRPPGTEPWTRIVFEKPFGNDLASACELNRRLLGILDESNIYRIDHYLGKETVQNVLAFRFANAVFEPLFNQSHVEAIFVTASETLGMEGGRGAYYDRYGALRDMVANHLLQLLSLVTMEPPADLTSDAVHAEKVKVLRAMHIESPDSACFGQYRGYRAEDRVAPDSRTDTFAAVRLKIDNWRWAGVPVIVRTGKRLDRKLTEVRIRFRKPPLELFRTVECQGDHCDISAVKQNELVFRIQPDEAVFLRMSLKRPVLPFVVEAAEMNFSYAARWSDRPLPEAYERLLLDAVRGDSTLFARSDELEAAWSVLEPLLQRKEGMPLHGYEPGTDGPAACAELMKGIA